MIFRELVQHKDGTLGTCYIPEMLPKLKGNKFVGSILKKEPEEYNIIPLMEMENCCLLRITVCRDEENATFGFLLHQEGKRSYEVRIEPSNASVGVYIAHTNPFERQGWELTHFIAEQEMEVCIRLTHGILDCCFQGDRTLVCRLENWQDGKICLLEGFIKDGSANFYLQD